jgi:signal transduction histidine kinase/ActR/RegA family two-component response regulator
MHDSLLIQITFDLLILTAIAFGGLRLHALSRKFGDQGKGISLILAGFATIGAYFLLEVLAIGVLPILAGSQSAARLSDLLGFNLRPYFNLAAAILIAIGIQRLTSSLLETQAELRRKADQARIKEAENRVLLSQLHQNQKVESLGTLAGGIAHDFNNILSSIINSAELLQIYVGDDEKARRNTDRIIKNGKKASNLIRQILTFSRMDSQELKPCDLSKLVAEDLEIVRATIPSYVEIEADLDSDIGTVLADRTQISQVTLNLITNAYHAIGDQPGHITVSVKRSSLAECKTNTSQAESPESVAIVVSDNGCGMDEAIQQRMFDPFFTTKEVGKGTGLGLSSVHGIVESHNGAISVDSSPGKGTTIKVCFPVSADSEEVEKSPEKVTGAIGKIILLAEDNQELGSLIKEHLERRGNRVDHLMDGVAAFEKFLASPDRYDLVITDQAIPSLSGRQLAEQLLQSRPDLPILLMTGYSESISEAQAKSMGIREFILKPFSLAELDRSVANCTGDAAASHPPAVQSSED